MSDALERREFLARSWKVGLALVGVAGAWTSWDLLQAGDQSGFGGEIRTVPEDQVPETPSTLETPEAGARGAQRRTRPADKSEYLGPGTGELGQEAPSAGKGEETWS